MPKLPDYTQLGAAPTPRPSTFVPGRHGFETAEAEALQGLAGAVQGFGETFDRIQDQNDRTRAEDAYNKLLEKRIDLTYGDQGFKEKRSADAANTNLMEDYTGRFNDAVNEASQGLNTPRQQKYFKDRANIAGLQYKQDLLRHVTHEQEVYQKEVFGATLKTEARNAATRWNDQKGINTSLVRINGVIDEQASREGWSKEKIDQTKFEAGSDVHVSVIQQAVNNKSPLMARDYFAENKDKIAPEVHDDVERIIKSAGLEELAQGVADDIQKRNLNVQDGLQEVRDKYSGEEEKAIIAAVKQRFNELQAAAADRAWEMYGEGVDLDRIKSTPGVWDQLSGMDKARLRDKFKADKDGGVKPGRGHYQQFRVLMMEDFNAFKEIVTSSELDRYSLNDSDRRRLIDIATVEQKKATALTDAKIINQTISVLGGDPKKLGDEKTIGITSRIQEEFDSEEAAKGKALTRREKQEIVDRLRINVLRERRWWLDASIPAAVIEIEGVPTHLIDELARNIKAAGQEVTEKNIKRAYHYYFPQEKRYTLPLPE